MCVPSSSHGDAWASGSGTPTPPWTHVRDREHSKTEKQRDTELGPKPDKHLHGPEIEENYKAVMVAF